jgi:hypothetical protein
VNTISDQIIQGLGLLGYEPGAPKHLTEEARSADAQACTESDCEACGRHGLDYRPFKRGRAYLALGVCPDCGHALEL